jgi:hypothetical protein
MQLSEWESICEVRGFQGMPSITIKPKKHSLHARHFVTEHGTGKMLFNIAKVRREMAGGWKGNGAYLRDRGEGEEGRQEGSARQLIL